MSDAAETWITCLTPSGVGALATLGLHGPDAWRVVRTLFRPRSGMLPETPRSATFRLGLLGEPAEEAVLTVGPRESTLELHCHGGREGVRFVLELFAAQGVRVVNWRTFLQRLSPDPLRAAAAVALAETTTVRTASILLDQYEGAFGRAVADLLSALDCGDVATASGIVDELARWAALGRHLIRPWRVVLAGPPNIGKSSLLNALAGYPRSIVAATPGTTRDAVTVRLAVEGWPIELVDTAGQRTSDDTLEEAGVALARAHAASADLCLWLLDATTTPVYPDAAANNVRLVVSKADLSSSLAVDIGAEVPRVSATTGVGVPELCAALATWLVPEVPTPGAAVPFTDQLCTAVVEVQRLLAEERNAEGRAVVARMQTGWQDGGFRRPC